MSIIALYVYAPTTFKTDTQIEAMGGASYAAGEVNLPPGIYRIDAGARLVPATGTGHEVVLVNGTKGGYPDPPLRALQYGNQTKDQIIQFLGGAGHEGKV
jgi:hypothetical protein